MNAIFLAAAMIALGMQDVETAPETKTQLYVKTVPDGAEVSLDNPKSTKIPFGVAMAGAAAVGADARGLVAVAVALIAVLAGLYLRVAATVAVLAVIGVIALASLLGKPIPPVKARSSRITAVNNVRSVTLTLTNNNPPPSAQSGAGR